MNITEKELPYISSFLAIIAVYSFKVASESCVVVFLYWMLFTAFIFLEVKSIRENIREHYMDAVFKKDSKPYQWLKDKNLFIFFISFVISVPLSTSLLIFIFLSDNITIFLMFVDALFFCWGYIKIKNSFDENLNETLNENFRPLLETWLLITVNTGLMTILYYTINYFSIEIFEPFSREIPIYVQSHVNHYCYPLHIVGRLVADIELEINALRSKNSLGFDLAALLYLATVSSVPFIAISFIFKRAVDESKRLNFMLKNGENYA